MSLFDSLSGLKEMWHWLETSGDPRESWWGATIWINEAGYTEIYNYKQDAYTYVMTSSCLSESIKGRSKGCSDPDSRMKTDSCTVPCYLYFTISNTY